MVDDQPWKIPPIIQELAAGVQEPPSRYVVGGQDRPAVAVAAMPEPIPIVDLSRLSAIDDADDEAAVRAAVVPGETRVVYVETMSNPTLAVADIPMLARVAHEAGAKLVVDNTFTPVVVSPARLGADVVVHSVSKFISGGADIIAGKDTS